MDSDHQRRAIRVATGPAFTLAFTLKGHPFRGLRIMNLSAGGCFVLLERRTARFFLPGEALEDLVLLHPDLPQAPLQATVAYVLGYAPGLEGEGQAGMGLRFEAVAPATRRALEAWVEGATAGPATT